MMRCKVAISVWAAVLLAVAVPAHAARVVVRVAPPPLIVEPIPASPGRGYYTWRPGYWSWTGARYVWIPGLYVAAPRVGAVWVPGHWAASGRGWVWVGGRWR